MGKNERQRGHDDGRAGRFKPPSGGSMTDAFVNPRNVDRATKSGQDYREGHKKGDAERRRNR